MFRINDTFWFDIIGTLNLIGWPLFTFYIAKTKKIITLEDIHEDNKLLMQELKEIKELIV